MWFDPRGELTSEQIGQAFADYLVGGLMRGTAPALPASAGPRR